MLQILLLLTAFLGVQLTNSVTLPSKLTEEAMNKKYHLVAKDHFFNQTQLNQETLQKTLKLALDNVLPAVLINMVNEYAQHYADIGVVVSIYSLAHMMNKRSDGGLFAFQMNIPLQYGDYYETDQRKSTKLYLHYEDVFLACNVILNRDMNPHDWVAGIQSSHGKEKFADFLNHKISSDSLFHKECFSLYFPYVDHFPLAIYWKYESTTLTRIYSAPIIKDKTTGDYLKSIEQGCYDILRDHEKINSSYKSSNLIIVCTACQGKIKKPKKSCLDLVQFHPYITDDSPFCNGRFPVCRTFRALRVFPKIRKRRRTEVENLL